jgi:hypothetical protein
VFENFRRSLGRAGMCCSQPTRIDYINPKKWATRIRRLEKIPMRVSSHDFLNLAPTLGRVKSSIPHGA